MRRILCVIALSCCMSGAIASPETNNVPQATAYWRNAWWLPQPGDILIDHGTPPWVYVVTHASTVEPYWVTFLVIPPDAPAMQRRLTRADWQRFVAGPPPFDLPPLEK